jgi:hypothetical protein
MPTELVAWLQQPFSPNMSAVRWFLLVGLILIALGAWRQIFKDFAHVEAEA